MHGSLASYSSRRRRLRDSGRHLGPANLRHQGLLGIGGATTGVTVGLGGCAPSRFALAA